jgi:ribosomal protein S18 acetylase RimI-like enzyme
MKLKPCPHKSCLEGPLSRSAGSVPDGCCGWFADGLLCGKRHSKPDHQGNSSVGGGTDIHLLPGKPADLPLIFQLERAYIVDYEPQNVLAWQSAMHRHLEQWVRCLPHTVVAAVGDEKVGYMFWEEASLTATLASIHVKPDYRRRAIGHKLLERFEEDAARLGCEIAELHVFVGNPAIHFYEAAAYIVTGITAPYVTLSKVLQIPRHSS